MMEKTARAADKAAEKAVQRCIDSACGATYGLRERIYVCPRCGGTLEINCHLDALQRSCRVAQTLGGSRRFSRSARRKRRLALSGNAAFR